MAADARTIDAMYERIDEELKTDNLDRATWTRAQGDADGNSERAKSLYIKYRAQRLLADDEGNSPHPSTSGLNELDECRTSLANKGYTLSESPSGGYRIQWKDDDLWLRDIGFKNIAEVKAFISNGFNPKATQVTPTTIPPSYISKRAASTPPPDNSLGNSTTPNKNVPAPNAPKKSSSWGWIWPTIIAAIIYKLIGILGGVVAFGTYYWLKPKFGTWRAVAASAVLGVVVGVGLGILVRPWLPM